MVDPAPLGCACAAARCGERGATAVTARGDSSAPLALISLSVLAASTSALDASTLLRIRGIWKGDPLMWRGALPYIDGLPIAEGGGKCAREYRIC